MADVRNPNPNQNQNQNNPQPPMNPQRAPTTGATTGAMTGTTRDPMRTNRSRGGELARPVDRSPFGFMQRFMRDMDRLFDDFPFGRATGTTSPWAMERADWVPQMDVFSAATSSSSTPTSRACVKKTCT